MEDAFLLAPVQPMIDGVKSAPNRHEREGSSRRFSYRRGKNGNGSNYPAVKMLLMMSVYILIMCSNYI